MASSRRTYDTDVITLRTVFAKNPGNSNIPGMRVLTADGQGGTYWAIPSSLGMNPSFNEIVTSAGTYTADLSYNIFRLLAGENMGMVGGPAGSNQTTLFAKAFSEIDISGENTLYAFRANQLDSSLSLAGQNGITLRGDPATNTLFIVGPASNAYTLSTGIYGFNQIKVTEAASTITSSLIGWDGTYLTATSPSTLLRFIGYNDIQLSTNVTTNSIFFTISTFTSKGYLDISANAYGAYPSTMSTVSSLYTPLNLFNSTISYLSSYTGFSFSSVVSSIDALAMSTGAEFYLLTGLINARAEITQLNSYSNAITNEMFSTTIGLGTIGYISTGTGAVVGQSQLISTVDGLGTAGYVSSAGAGDVIKANLFSTVAGLGSAGYISSLSTITTSSIFNTGAISTYSLEVFGPATLTNSGSTILRGPVYVQGPLFIASTVSGSPGSIVAASNLTSTVQGLGTTYVSTPSLVSTTRGLGAAGYISSTQLRSSLEMLASQGYVSSSQLTSSLRGIGSMGYLSALRGFSVSSGNIFVSSINLLDVYTSAVNYITISSGSLLVNGAKIEGGGGGGGGGAVAQLLAGTNISLSPGSGTGIVTINNVGPTQTDIANSISSFSTALGGSFYNFSTVSSSYASTFTTALLNASTMTTANILPSQSNLWVAVGYGATTPNSIQFSGNGSNWSNATLGGFSLAGKGVAYNGSLWVAVGNNGGASGSIQTSTDGRNWVNGTSGGFSSGGNGVAYNGSLWIAVGNNGGAALTSIQTSRDGRSWSGISSGGFGSGGESVAWNGSYWVAVGLAGSALDTIQTSVDGQNWVSALSGGFSAGGKGIAWNGSLWVAVGDDSTRAASIQYSGDGRNWSNAASGGFISAGAKIAWNGRLWVAVGDDNVAAKSIQISVDGSNWSDVGTGGFSGDGYAIAWNGSYWVAGGIAGSAVASLQTSVDGSNWTNASSGGFASGCIGLAFSSNLAPGYSQQNLTILSQNIPLYLKSTNQIFAQPSSLLFDNTLLVDGQWKRVGVNCNSPQTALDVGGVGRFTSLSSFALNVSTINGLPVGLPGFPSTVSTLNAVSFLTSSLVVSTINGIPFGLPGYPSTVSTNYGRLFITSSLTTSSISQVNIPPTNNNVWLAVGADGTATNRLKYSTDGSNWSNSAITLFNYSGRGIAYNGSVWVAVGDDTSRPATIKYSLDGTTWSNAVTGGFGSVTFDNYIGYDVAWNGSMWVAVGYHDTTNNTIQYSYNGSNWNNSLGSGWEEGHGVAWNGRIWVAVGYDSISTTNTMKTSKDGITWTAVSGNTFSDEGNGVAWNGKMWVAVGYDIATPTKTIKYSYDGLTWTDCESGGFNDRGYKVAWNGNLWVAVGADPTNANTIQYSYDGKNWFPCATGGFTQAGLAVQWNGRIWTALGWSGNSIKYSYDGITWYDSANSFGLNSYGLGYSSNTTFPYRQANLDIMPQTIPLFYRSTNQILAMESSIVLNNTLNVDGVRNLVGINQGYPQADLDVGGVGRFKTLSTQALNVSSINGLSYTSILPSTVEGLATAGYISTLSLNSSIEGLGTAGYISTLSLNSTLEGLGTAGYVSTLSLNSTVAGLGNAWINSTVQGLGNSGYVSTLSLNSTVQGLGTAWFNSTVRGLGQIYLSSPTTSSIQLSTGQLFASSITTSSIYCANTISTYSLAVFGPQTLIVDGLSYFKSNVGIGTTNPQTTLDVNGVGQFSSMITFGNVAGRKLVLRTTSGNAYTGRYFGQEIATSEYRNVLDQNTSYFTWGDQNAGVYTEYARLTNTGLGLGTNNPTTRLDVAGTGTFQGVTTQTVTTQTATTQRFIVSSISQVNIAPASNNLWVAVGTSAGGNIRYSANGLNWTGISANDFDANGGFGVAWNGSLWVAVGSDSTQLNRIKYSGDGINWSNSMFGGFLDDPFAFPSIQGKGYGVAWNGSLWVAVGVNTTQAGTIINSTDGINWTNASSGGFTGSAQGLVYGRGVAWNGRLWVAVGKDDTQNNNIQYSGDGQNWSNSAGPGFGDEGYAVTWNGRLWVAVGQDFSSPSNTIKYSFNGINWSNSLSGGFSASGRGVAWNGRMFVAVGSDSTQNNRIKYSYDGMNWSNSTSGAFDTYGAGIAWNGSMWIAVGETTNRIKYSYDGLVWSNVSSGDLTTYGYGIAYSSNLTPAYQQSNLQILPQGIPLFINTSNQILTTRSTLVLNNTLTIDGFSDRVGINTGFPQTDLDVAGTGRFQTVSTLALNISSINGTIYSAGGGGGSSGNGSSITVSTAAVFASTINFVNIPSYTSNIWVVVGEEDTYKIKYSLNGISWLPTTGGFLYAGYGVAYNGRMWVAVGYDDAGQGYRYSYNGINWARITGAGWSTGAGNGVAWNGRMWVAVGNEGGANSIQYSFDGFTWTASASGGFSTAGYGIGWSGKMWVALGEGGGSIKYSYNGSNWTTATGAFGSYGKQAAWNGSLWVAVGADSTAAVNRIKYSGDGINWSNASSGVPTDFQEGSCVGWNGLRWVVGGYTNTMIPGNIILYGTTGSNWSSASTGPNKQAFSVTWNGYMWVLGGWNSTDFNGLYYSQDGTAWTEITGNPMIKGIGVAWSSNVAPSYKQENLELYSYKINMPLYLRSTNQITAQVSSLVINNTLLVDANSLRVGIGTYAPAYTLDVNGTINAFTAVKSNGTNLTSDRRIKQFITTADLDICYSNVKNLPLRRFEFIDAFKVTKYDGKQVGFIADEVEQYYPKAVNLFSTNVGGFSTIKHLNYDQIFFANFGATKKLMTLVESQDSTIKGQAMALDTLNNQFSFVFSTLEGLQGR